MITLEEYKMYLINSYVYEIDNTDKKRQERKNYLEEKYKDVYINKIIEDTYKIIELIQKEQDKKEKSR